MAAQTSFRMCLVFGLLFVCLAQWPGSSRGRPGDSCGPPPSPMPMPFNLGPFMPQAGRRGASTAGLSMMQAMVLEQLDMTELALLQMAFPGAIVPRPMNTYHQGRQPQRLPPAGFRRRPPPGSGPPPPPEREGRPPLFPPPPGPPRRPPRPANAPPPRSPFGRPPPGRSMVRPPPGPPPADVFARPPSPPRNAPPRSPNSFPAVPAVSIQTIPYRPQPGRSPVPVFPSGRGRRPEAPQPRPGRRRPRPPFRPPPRTPPSRGPLRPPPGPYRPRPRAPPSPPRGGGGFNPYMALMLEQLDIPDPLLPLMIQSASSQGSNCRCASASACGQGYGRPAYGYSNECDGRFNLVCCCQ